MQKTSTVYQCPECGWKFKAIIMQGEDRVPEHSVVKNFKATHCPGSGRSPFTKDEPKETAKGN